MIRFQNSCIIQTRYFHLSNIPLSYNHDHDRRFISTAFRNLEVDNTVSIDATATQTTTGRNSSSCCNCTLMMRYYATRTASNDGFIPSSVSPYGQVAPFQQRMVFGRRRLRHPFVRIQHQQQQPYNRSLSSSSSSSASSKRRALNAELASLVSSIPSSLSNDDSGLESKNSDSYSLVGRNNNYDDVFTMNDDEEATPDVLRRQIATAMHDYMLVKSPEMKRAKKDEYKLRTFEKLLSVDGQRLVDEFEQYVVYENADDANKWAEEMIQTLDRQQAMDNTKPICVGVHVGWNIYGKRRERSVTHLLSLSFPNQPVICISLYKMNCYNNVKNFPEKIRTLLQLPYIKGCGININRCLARMKRYLHIIVPARIEVDKLALIMEPRTIKEEMRQEMGYLDFYEDTKKRRLPSMKLLCNKYLNVDIDATIGLPHSTDYFQDPMPERILKFVTLESYHYRLLCETMMTMIANDITMPQPSTKFQTGTKVKVYIGSKINHVAEGIIEYLGGINGESICFGEKMINQGMALVRVVDVIIWDAKPKYAKETYMLYGPQWERDLTLGTVFGSTIPLIAIETKRLVRMDDVDKNLFVEKPVKKKKLSRSRLKKLKRRKEHKKLKKEETADTEAKMSNYWNF